MNLPSDRTGQPASADLAARRAGLAGALAGGLGKLDSAAEPIDLDGIRALRFSPPAAADVCVFHLHGGGFRIGCPEQVARFASALSATTGATLVCPAYRLAPEAPFPAGLRDAWTAYRALHQAGGRRMVISGDSAGGGLAAGLTALAIAHGMAPIGLVLLSPWLDLTVTNPDYAANAVTDPLFSAESARDAAAAYLQGVKANDPLASPLFGDLVGFPPTFVSVGTGEVLAGDARAFAEALDAVGAQVELDLVPDMEHVAVTRGLGLTGAQATFDRVATFVRERIG